MLTLTAGLFLVVYGFMRIRALSEFSHRWVPEMKEADFNRFQTLEKRAMIGMISGGLVIALLPLLDITITTNTGEDVSLRFYLLLTLVSFAGFLMQVTRAEKILRESGIKRSDINRRMKEAKERPWSSPLQRINPANDE